ncbi:MAG: HNH endonuclease [Burkholderiales bacterium]
MGSLLGTRKVAATRIGVSLGDYLQQIAAQKKWCHKCRSWKPPDQFGRDRHRTDGYYAICRLCRYRRKTSGPTKTDRRQMLAQNKKWCSKCNHWLDSKFVHAGLCRQHANEYVRKKYITDFGFRLERKQHAHSRKRGVEPIPPEAQEMLLEEFDGKCAYCDKPADTWDHILPISRGGLTIPSNVVPACASCNSSKKNSELFAWLERTARTFSDRLIDRMSLAEAGLPLAVAPSHMY